LANNATPIDNLVSEGFGSHRLTNRTDGKSFRNSKIFLPARW